MRLSELTEQALTEQIADKVLFGGLDYTGESADLIFVLGSRKAREYRVPLAAELFFAGKADKILMSGGKRQPLYDMRPEYEVMRETAEALGIPCGAIITEERSMNTDENMLFSREIIEREVPERGRVILVTTAYHMRRSVMLAEKIMPRYTFIPCPAQRGSTARDNWRLTEKGISTACDECMKLQYLAEHGLIEDMEIEDNR